ncbi:type II toxin-antitoxin system RelE/ParE family toxin [Xenorhabdus innexi]|uniref:Addiction module toxin RelE n=1 Tax=Xenorhabdus innexi TaxID=290109 RepID=A0A2G0N2W3_9GAMM|nr:type II toxin-antitoxin system RelE/ParE family toxin [Xenorhabdus innexi]PHM29074.1 addiction module toxin RelE [Xenorhabdus innexi]
MRYNVEWKQGAIEDIMALFDYIAENSSLWDARNVTDRLLNSTDKLAEFPRLYEVDSRYGENVRRISLVGQHVLYEVDDKTKRVSVLAVVGQRQNPHPIHTYVMPQR